MVFFVVTLKNIPRIIFAQSVLVKNYSKYFDRISDFLEIAYMEKGVMRRENGSYNDSLGKGSALAITSLSDYKVSCTDEQVHTTVGVRVQYDCRQYDSEKLSSAEIESIVAMAFDAGCYLLPEVCEVPEILNYIKNISHNFVLGEQYTQKVALSKWFELMGILTKICIDELLQNDYIKSKTSDRYVESIKTYIAENFNKKLKVSDIAKAVSVSESHLHRIFRLYMGTSAVSYINRIKVEAAKSLVEHYDASLQEAAEHVGISDPFYFSRMFKKETGVSFSEYRTWRLALTKKS